MQKATITGDYSGAQMDTLVFMDSLYLLKTRDNIPLRYFTIIHTSVCFDNKCRALAIIVYWNITGRYLGFELPAGEFLSKAEHVPFTAEEYERMNELLSDPSLPLGGISFDELTKPSESKSGKIDASGMIDAVSSATSKEVAEIVVKGAAYTTYKLWNIVYGPTQEFVASLTETLLTPGLIDLILKSPDNGDRAWALNRIDQSTALDSKLTSSLLDIISGDQYFLAYSAINAIAPVHLKSESFQSELFSKYREVDHNVKKMIIEKLMKAPHLSSEIVTQSRSMLEELNGQQLGDFLKLYATHSVNDTETCRTIARLLKSENRYISQQAFKFLKGVNTSDPAIIENINAYDR
jgi:hypothetical protein